MTLDMFIYEYGIGNKTHVGIDFLKEGRPFLIENVNSATAEGRFTKIVPTFDNGNVFFRGIPEELGALKVIGTKAGLIYDGEPICSIMVGPKNHPVQGNFLDVSHYNEQ